MAEETSMARLAMWLVPGAVLGLVAIVFATPGLICWWGEP